MKSQIRDFSQISQTKNVFMPTLPLPSIVGSVFKPVLTQSMRHSFIKLYTSKSNSHENIDIVKTEEKLVEESLNNIFYFHQTCSNETQTEVINSFSVATNFISEEEENVLYKEVEPHLKRLRYEHEHFDDAIHGYRETERGKWTKASQVIIERLKRTSFPEESNQLPQIHVLDLAKDGVIKPHVDSVRFCGDIISGLCLMSSAVMRLVHCENKNQVVDVLLPRRSLYVMKDASRYKFTHAILAEEESYFGRSYIPRDRRISIICRNHPKDN